MIQDEVWTVSIVLMGCLAAVYVWIAVGASAALANYGPAIDSAYRLRTWLFVLAILVIIGANYKGLEKLPYVTASTPAPSTGVVTASAVGEQWAWTIKPDTFTVGQTAEFHVTTKDVNHGFGLYDPNLRIVAQTQAMPGYTNVVRYTFTEPGTYQVLCLEYCGLEHHDMKTEIKVTNHP